VPMKKCKPEQIVAPLRQVDLESADGKADPQACKEAETAAQTYYRSRKEFGGLKLDQAGRRKDLEREDANGPLRDERISLATRWSLEIIACDPSSDVRIGEPPSSNSETLSQTPRGIPSSHTLDTKLSIRT